MIANPLLSTEYLQSIEEALFELKFKEQDLNENNLAEYYAITASYTAFCSYRELIKKQRNEK